MKYFLMAILLAKSLSSMSQLDSLLRIRGFCIAAPNVENVDRFADFIQKELGPKNINTLVLRVDYNYQYTSHPELQNESALSKQDVQKLVVAARSQNIRLIPQINLLGHQSWAESLENLLKVYPEFDETPHVKMPKKYTWPNADSLYCKSYCTLHPDVHQIVFDLVDEIVEAFEADAFHAGLDEVFYIGHDQCSRCKGKDKAKLYADEVTNIRNHLAKDDIQLWMWGDRLLDGKNTGIGMWEGSENYTHAAIDMIPKDVMICDWHYEKAEPTPPYFAMKGLNVISCPWRIGEVGIQQINQMITYQKDANKTLGGKMQGVMQTIWRSAASFMDTYYDPKKSKSEDAGDIQCFNSMTEYFTQLNQEK